LKSRVPRVSEAFSTPKREGIVRSVNAMKKTVFIKGPLAERLQELADQEEMTLEEIVDFILRSYFEEWEDDDIEDEDSDE
jgi:hypothetical protein